MTEYLSLREAASMESVDYNAFRLRVYHHKDDYVIQRRPRKGGGRPEVFISVSSLSPAAQRRYRRQKKKEAAAAGDAGAPWYVDAEPDRFIQEHLQEFVEATVRMGLFAPILEAGHGEKGTLVSRAAQVLELSEREVYRITKRLLEAKAWAKDKEKESGMTRSFQHFLIMSLCRAPAQRQTFPSLPEEQRALIRDILYNQKPATKTQLYDVFKEQAMIRNWTIPSEKTVARYVNSIRSKTRMEVSTCKMNSSP